MTARQPNTPAKKRAGNFMAILGVAADITAIAALVFSKDLHAFVQITAIAGLAVGTFLLLREWGRPVGVRVLLAMACIIAGFVAGALSLQATSSPASGGTNSSGTTGTPTSGTNATANGTDTAFQFRLQPDSGIDLDAGTHSQKDVVDTDGPNGDIDIFMSEPGYIQANGGSFYIDTEGPDSEIHNRCAKAVASQRDPHVQILPSRNTRACFKTSSGKTGWLRSNDADFTNQTYAVLNVKIW